MDIKKIITLSIIGIIAFAISLVVTKWFIRKERLKSEESGKILLAYGVLFSSWVISFSILNLKMLSTMDEFIDIIIKINNENPILVIAKTSILLIGITNVWLVFSHFITKALSILIASKRIDVIEIETNNFVYFVLKGIVFIGSVYSLMPVFESILRTILPNIEIPYYR